MRREALKTVLSRKNKFSYKGDVSFTKLYNSNVFDDLAMRDFLSKEAYEFWSRKDLDFNLEDYLFDAEDFVADNDIPEAANFLYNKEDDYYQEWFELEGELEHSYGAEYNNCWVTVEETETEENRRIRIGVKN